MASAPNNMRRLGSLFLTLSLLLAASASAHDDMTPGRLTTLGRIWGIVKYSHPALAYRDIDWDAAGIRAIAKARMARSETEFVDAVEEMLAELRDPVTRVDRACHDSATSAPPRQNAVVGDAVYIAVTANADAAILSELRRSRVAIVDLRPLPGRCSAPSLAPEVAALLFRGTLTLPTHRKVMHDGYRSQRDGDESRYTSGFIRTDGGTRQGSDDTLVEKTSFIVDDRSAIPAFAISLFQSGRASFVSVGPFQPRPFVDHCEIGLSDGRIATIRSSELIDEEGYPGDAAPAATLPADASEEAVIAAAVEAARPVNRQSRRRSAGPIRMVLPDYDWKRDAAYEDTRLPSVEQRILTAYRLWNAIYFLHGTRELIAQWNERFADVIAMLEEASTQRDYELALAHVMALTGDGQSAVESDAWLDLHGRAAAPFRIAPVEGKPVVIEILDESATAAGVQLGDEVVRIDGRDVEERLAALEHYLPHSTEAAKLYALYEALPRGATDSSAVFTLRKPDGATRDAAVKRSNYTAEAPEHPWRIIDGDVAYADLRHVSAAEVPSLFDAIAGTRGLILDLRNGASNVPDELLARLNIELVQVVAEARVPGVSGGAHITRRVSQLLADTDDPIYTGKTIVLIDASVRGDAERAALVLETAAGTRFVGSPTAGTSGDTTYMVMPGGIFIRFSAADLRYTDGSALQRTGVVPDFVVRPTVNDIASSRDPLIDRAVELLR